MRRLAKRNEPVPSSINDRVTALWKENGFRWPGPRSRIWIRLQHCGGGVRGAIGEASYAGGSGFGQAGKGYGGGGRAVDSGTGAGVVGEVSQTRSPLGVQRLTEEIVFPCLRPI